jgi:hypothetical protein
MVCGMAILTYVAGISEARFFRGCKKELAASYGGKSIRSCLLDGPEKSAEPARGLLWLG